MTVNPSSGDEQALREIWSSFRSLLQAYLAAGSVAVEVAQALLVSGESTPGDPTATLHVVGAANTIKLVFEPVSGKGYWAVYGSPGKDATVPLDEGQFRLAPDATFEWSGKQGRLELDAVAEALTMLALEPAN